MRLFDRDKQIMVDVLGDLYSRSKIVILKILGGFLGSYVCKGVHVETFYFFDNNNLPCLQSDKCPETVR